MCGITGFWNQRAPGPPINLKAVVLTMAERLQKRGPDSFGIWIDPQAHLALGHRRLSIVDLSETGHQPMMSHSNRFVLSYNGELYNTAELRRNLEQSGCCFRGSSDTEVILEACAHWGVEKAVTRFIGMFAFALWDRQEHRLILVRDRLGIKPLYWGFQGSLLFFGSELKSFFPHPEWNPEIYTPVLQDYMRFNYIPTPFSIYRNIYKLRPGYWVQIDKRGRILEKPYWTLKDVVQSQTPLRARSLPRADSQEISHRLKELLKEVVGQHMVADVPVGAFLSGGIDSSLMVALMQTQRERPIQTFSIGFSEADYNEAPYAKKIAHHLGTDHHEVYISPQDVMDVIPKLSEWYDEPFADMSQIPTYLVSRLARQFVKVVLSGDGGDEVFGGYNRYLFVHRFGGPLSRIPRSLKYAFGKALAFLPSQVWDRLGRLFIPRSYRPPRFGDKIHFLSSLLSHTSPSELYTAIVSVVQDPALFVQERESVHHWPQEVSGLSPPEHYQYLDTLTYLPDDILTKLDRASMAVSLEARVPLLDHRVVEFAWGLPQGLKLHNGASKWVLRHILKTYIPPRLTERPKMGFGIPMGNWLRGPLRDWSENLLQGALLEEAGWRAEPIQALWRAHLKGHQNQHPKLWGILMYQEWVQRMKKMQISSYPAPSSSLLT